MVYSIGLTPSVLRAIFLYSHLLPFLVHLFHKVVIHPFEVVSDLLLKLNVFIESPLLLYILSVSLLIDLSSEFVLV